MKKNKKLELKKETITILDKMQTGKVVGGAVYSARGTCIPATHRPCEVITISYHCNSNRCAE